MALDQESKIEGVTWRLSPIIDDRETIRKIWTKFGGPFNAIRFEVDVLDPPSRYQAMFSLARELDFYLVPMLKGVVHFHGDDWPRYVDQVGTFVKGLSDLLDYEEYKQIATFQIEHELNHWLLHHREIPHLHKDEQLNLLIETSLQIRSVERELERPLTPLMVNYSFDTIFYRSFDWRKSYEDYFKPYVTTVCRQGSIDVVGVDWYPQTWTPGSPHNLVELVKLIIEEFEQRVMIAETGYSTGKQSEQKQFNYYESLRAELETLEDHFFGICWYELFDGYRTPGLGLNPFSFIEDHFGLVKSQKGASGSMDSEPKMVYKKLFEGDE